MATAALTGTVTATTYDTHIIAGGKTIILTLTGDIFLPTSAGVTFVGSESGPIASGGGTVDLDLPAGLVENDIVLIAIACDNALNSDGVDSGAGYTAIYNSSANDPGHNVAYKRMGSTPDTTVTVNRNATAACAYVVQAFRGVDATTALDATPTSTDGSSDSTDADHPSITTVTDGAMVVAIAVHDDDDATATYPSGYTNGDYGISGGEFSGNLGAAVAMSSKIVASHGAEDPAATVFSASDSWWAYTVALRPAASPVFADSRQDLIDGMDSAQSETHGWDAEVKGNQGVSGVVRTSDTVCTITLDAQAGYVINATETITVTIPGSILSSGNPIVASPTFTVAEEPAVFAPSDITGYGYYVRLHDADGALKNVPPIFGGTGTMTSLSYEMVLGRIGSFSFTTPADSLATVALGDQAWIYAVGEGLVFKGIVNTTEYQTDESGQKNLVVTGGSLALELQKRSIGLGLVFEDADFSDSIDAILYDTSFVHGTLDTSVNIPARRLDGRQKWEALQQVADIYQYLYREDMLADPPEIDMGAFGTDSGLTFTNRRTAMDDLSTNPEIVPLQNLKVLSQANDIVNRVYPVGQIQGLGGALLTLEGVSSSNPVATRLYLRASGSTAITPTADGSWEDTNEMVRRPAGIDRSGTTMGLETFTKDSSSNLDVACYQFIYGPLQAQTISGNVKAQVLVNENVSGANAYLQMNIRVIAPDGSTVRGTALAHSTYGNELVTTVTNHTFPSTALSSVAAQEGDYLVIEMGYRGTGATTSSSSFYMGDDGSEDLPENETSTSSSPNPWIEFSNYIPLKILVSATSYAIQTATINGVGHYYLEDSTSVTAYGLSDRVLNIKDILPLGLSASNLSKASETLYGAAVTYLERHKDPQVAYSVQPVGLRHVSSGSPLFQVGDKVHIDYKGTVEDADGTRRADKTVSADLYIMSARRTFDSSGGWSWQMTVSTIARPLPSDSELIASMLSEIGVAKIAPIPFFEFSESGGHSQMRLDAYGIQLATKQVESTAIYGVEELLARPDQAVTVWKLVGQVIQGLGLANVTLSAADSKVYLNDGVDPLGYIEVGGDPVLHLWPYSGAGDGLGPHAWLPPQAAFALASTQTAISSGAIDLWAIFDALATGPAPYAAYVIVDTESAASSDNLDNIWAASGSATGLRKGQYIVLQAANSARTVVVTESGNCKLNGGSMSLDNAEDTITLIWNGSAWCEIARSNNGT